MPAIVVRGLRKSYGALEALRGIDLEIAAGEVFCLLGPNGAGKTTTVEILEGYRKRDGGDVVVLGFDPERRERAFRELIGVVLQSSETWPSLSVTETVRIFAGYYEHPRPVDRVRPAGAPCRVGDDPRAARARQDDPADDALPRRGAAARRPRRGASRRQHRHDRKPERAGLDGADGDPLSRERRGRRPANREPDEAPARADQPRAARRPRARGARGAARIARGCLSRPAPRGGAGVRLFAHQL